MRFLLIGGSGFIGSFVAAQLIHLGHEVVIFIGGGRPDPPLGYQLLPAHGQSSVTASICPIQHHRSVPLHPTS